MKSRKELDNVGTDPEYEEGYNQCREDVKMLIDELSIKWKYNGGALEELKAKIEGKTKSKKGYGRSYGY